MLSMPSYFELLKVYLKLSSTVLYVRLQLTSLVLCPTLWCYRRNLISSLFIKQTPIYTRDQFLCVVCVCSFVLSFKVFCLFVLFFFERVSHYVALTILELEICLPPPPKCWY